MSARQALSQPKITGEAAVLLDLETGKVLWTKEEKKRLQPGGILKVLTGLVALQQSRPDELVTVSSTAASAGGFSARLSTGEQIRMEDLLRRHLSSLLFSVQDSPLGLEDSTMIVIKS